MKPITSKLYFNCIGGMYFGIVFVSFLFGIVLDSDFSAKQVFLYYAIAMMTGMFLGAAISWIDLVITKEQSANNPHPVLNQQTLVKFFVGSLFLMCLVLVVYL